MPTRASLAVETKSLLFLWLANLNNKSNVYKQIPSTVFFPIVSQQEMCWIGNRGLIAE